MRRRKKEEEKHQKFYSFACFNNDSYCLLCKVGVVMPGESRVRGWLEKMLSFGEKALLCAIWGGVYLSSWRCHIAYLLSSNRHPKG